MFTCSTCKRQLGLTEKNCPDHPESRKAFLPNVAPAAKSGGGGAMLRIALCSALGLLLVAGIAVFGIPALKSFRRTAEEPAVDKPAETVKVTTSKTAADQLCDLITAFLSASATYQEKHWPFATGSAESKTDKAWREREAAELAAKEASQAMYRKAAAFSQAYGNETLETLVDSRFEHLGLQTRRDLKKWLTTGARRYLIDGEASFTKTYPQDYFEK